MVVVWLAAANFSTAVTRALLCSFPLSRQAVPAAWAYSRAREAHQPRVYEPPQLQACAAGCRAGGRTLLLRAHVGDLHGRQKRLRGSPRRRARPAARQGSRAARGPAAVAAAAERQTLARTPLTSAVPDSGIVIHSADVSVDEATYDPDMLFEFMQVHGLGAVSPLVLGSWWPTMRTPGPNLPGPPRVDSMYGRRVDFIEARKMMGKDSRPASSSLNKFFTAQIGQLTAFDFRAWACWWNSAVLMGEKRCAAADCTHAHARRASARASHRHHRVRLRQARFLLVGSHCNSNSPITHPFPSPPLAVRFPV